MTSFSKLRFGKEISELTINDIQLLTDNQIDESQNLDYKQPSSDSQTNSNNLAEVISSFLNTDGGLVVYGLAESKYKTGHCLPSTICWTVEPKEKIENSLVSKVQPWSENVIIRRIANDKNPVEGIYVIEIPKSNNPPHMFNFTYLQRYNFQKQHMSHESVYRAFQTSWIRRRDIISQIIEPIYSEIKGLIEGLYKIEIEGQPDSYYEGIKKGQSRFLFDKLTEDMQDKIDEFYDRILKITPKMENQAYKIAINVVNLELAEMFPEIKQLIMGLPSTQQTILLNIKMEDISGAIEDQHDVSIYWALFRKQSLFEFLEKQFPNEAVVDYKAMIESASFSISAEEFNDFWGKCEDRARKDTRFIEIWDEIDELIELGHILLNELNNS